MAGTTADKLQGIIDAKADIASAITTKGGTVPSLFEDYGDAIRAIPSGGTPVISSLNVTPSTSAQTITAPSGTDGYSPVNVSAVTSSIDQNIVAGNIKSGVSILGVTGTYEGGGGGGNELLKKLVENKAIPSYTISASDLSGITQIGNYAFDHCAGLTSVTIPDSVTSIGQNAFHFCYGLTSVTFGSGLTSIGDSAFYNCNGVTGPLTIPNGVTSIGQNAFYGCSGFTSLAIPSSVTSIGNDAFFGCTGVTTITCDSGNPSYSASGNFLLNKTGTSIVIVPGGATSLSIPSGVTNTGAIFKGNTVIQSLTIPNSVTSLNEAAGGAAAFDGCTSLSSVTLGTGITSIPTYTFRNCPLTTITIPDTVTSIGQFAFSGCSSLQSIVFGSGITSINQAFGACSSCLLFDFRNATQVPTLSNTSAFNQTNANKKIVVPDNLYDSWKAANNWKSTTNGIVTAITRASDYNP